jgi:hypothetical protein
MSVCNNQCEGPYVLHAQLQVKQPTACVGFGRASMLQSVDLPAVSQHNTYRPQRSLHYAAWRCTGVASGPMAYVSRCEIIDQHIQQPSVPTLNSYGT